MKFFTAATVAVLALADACSARIWDNEQLRPPTWINTAVEENLLDRKAAKEWRTYNPNAKEISYKGRWDKKYISWWSAPGIKFGFTGDKVALSFGEHTIDTTLIAYRYAGLDWQFTNVTSGTSHVLITERPHATNINDPTTFEMVVTNWAYGVQLTGVHVHKDHKIFKIPNFKKKIQVIGDSLSAGMYASYEGLSSWAYLTAAGFGNVEYSIVAYPGICATDANCWGNPRGQVYQWSKVQDGNVRQQSIYGDKPDSWDFSKEQPADIVIINLGTNDNNTANALRTEQYVEAYGNLLDQVHKVWPRAEIIAMGLWNGFGQSGETYLPSPAFVDELPQIVKDANRRFRRNKVHYFDVTGILQHNDIGPGTWHPTDIGQLKVAAQMQMYIKMKFGWKSESTGPMVHSGTYIYNDECCY